MRKKRVQPDIDICERCDNEIIDRKRLGFSKLKYCGKCARDVINERIRNRYRDTHPKKPLKKEIIIKRLTKSPATEPELVKLSKSKNSVALRASIAKLRNEGYIIQAIHFMPSHYVLVNSK
ncbi:hypothetical protein LCGC14_1921030 [marine sediment metagenome]|uniref:Uncharacterized protein n=1 Tax=marine sediment metagenome TaxID=412755 RepID=A0A0F9FRM5_9ZZZZ